MEVPASQSAAGGEYEEYAATQPLSQDQDLYDNVQSSHDVWGYLVPCDQAMVRIDLKKPVFKLGRHAHNDVALEDPIIS